MRSIQTIVKSTVLPVFMFVSLTGCNTNVNTNNHPKFTKEGYFINDSTSTVFKMEDPSLIKFYVEVSGSMNGFFRSNLPTYFKQDFWKILNYYSSISNPITVLTNSGAVGARFSLSDFQSKMNTGAFMSSASTKVPVMLRTIMSNLNAEKGEVAVLVSDMKYSPVGSQAPNVLMTQYSTDVSRILGDFNQSVCLIGATSNFISRNAEIADSPYYYLILGKQEYVATVRNVISTLLEQQGRFVDNIESGFDYGRPRHSFSISNKCDQFDDEPTFTNYEEATDADTCTIRLKVNLEDYRWIMADEYRIRKYFKAKALYGSQVDLGKIKIDVENITGESHDLNRKACASVDLKIYNMYSDSDVIEWTLDIPNTEYTLFNKYFEGATDEGDATKSYSLMDFVRGMFQGGVVSKDLKPNYILISKKG